MKVYKFTITIFHRNLLIAILFIIAVSYNFSSIFFGLDFTDSFYHLNQAINPANEIYLYPFFLSSALIKGIVDIAGPEIINLRVVNWFLLSFSILIPFLFLKVQRERSIIFFYIAVTLILFTPFNANILGYDTLSIFILSLIFSVTALYIKTRNPYLVFFLSLFCAAAILIRLPNMLTIPIIFLFLLVSERVGVKDLNSRKIMIPALYVLLSFLFVLAGYFIYYDTREQFVLATSNSESHHLLFLFSLYLKDGLKLLGFIFLILLGWYGYKNLLVKNRLPLVKSGILIIFFITALSFFVGFTKFSFNYSLFLVALAIAFILIHTYYGRREKLSQSRLIIYLFLFFLFINPFGSNTGLLKAYSFLLLLPFILSISAVKDKKYWLMLIAVLIPFSFLTKVFGVYEDKNLLALDEELKLEKLSQIHTNSERANFLKETDAAVQHLSAQGIEVFFYGDKSHIFHYLYPETSLGLISFFQPVDELVFLEEVEKVLRGKESVAVFIVNSYPEYSPTSLSLLEQGLIINGFEKIEDDKIQYYSRTSNSKNL